jgi:hypothetical protein
MRTQRPRALFLLTFLLSLPLLGCFGGHGGGGGGGNGGGGGGVPTPKLRVDFTGGPFSAFQQGASFTLMVRNKGDAATSGLVTLTDPPTGMTVTSIAGSNWTCTLSTTTCTRSDSLAPGGTYDPITVVGNVTVGAGGSVSATVTLTGGGAATFSGSGSISVMGGGNVSLLSGQYAFLFSGFDANGAVSIVGSINVDQNGNVTGEEDFKDSTTLLTAQAVAGFCQNLQVAASGFCKLTAGGKTSQYDFVLRNNGTVARVAEDPADGANVGSGVLITQRVPSSNALTSAGGFNGYFSIGFAGTDSTGGRMAVEGNIFTDLGANVTPGTNGSQADINDNGTLIQPSGSTSNVTGKMTGPVDANGRATMTMTIGTSPSSRTLTLALYILAPEVPTSNQSGRAFAIDITPIATSKQVLSGQLFWLGNPVPTFDNSSFSGVNVFALSGVVPGTTASSNTVMGILTAQTSQTGQILFDVNNAGMVNGAGGLATPLAGTYILSIVASNGRAVLSVTVNNVVYTYVLYLDAANDGSVLGATVGAAADTTVNFGFFTGQAANSKFNNTHISGTYVVGTDAPVLAAVPNGVSPVTLTPGAPNSGTFSAGAVSGNYSFDPTTGRGTALASSGKLFQNSNSVFYIITPGFIVVMGGDQTVTNDAIAFLQF